MKYCILLIFLLPAIILKSQDKEKSNQAIVSEGKFKKIFDQSSGEKDSWYINDHCFIQGPDETWHMFGITGRDAPHKWEEIHFAHAVAESLTGEWIKKPYALSCRQDLNETVLWAPHIIKHKETYYMFYCGGDPDHRRYQINLATSRDLYEWSRYTGNPLFTDGYDGRDPFIFHDDLNKRWILYYTATSKPEGGYHIVGAKISSDLIHWSKDRYVVFKDTAKGTWGGNTESPQVIRRGDWYYLFIGPGASYKTTKVYKSQDMFNWDISDEVAELETHAAELIIDNNGKWCISHCGLNQKGLYLAPFYWHDGIKVNH